MSEPLKTRVVRFFAEGARRKVYTSAVAYLAVAMVLLQIGPPIFRALIADENAVSVAERILTLLLILMFPVVIVLAWIFDVGPEGVHRTPADDAGPAHNRLAHSGTWSPAPMTMIDVEPEPEYAAPIPMERQAPDAGRLRRAALAFVRHELRTPINAIIGYSEMLTEDVRDEKDEAAAQDLIRITDGGRQLLRLVEEILDAERISAEQRDVDSYSAQIRADLRDPLSAVMGYTEMLIETSREDGATQRVPDLERILSAAGKLLDISNDIERLATRAHDEAGGVSRAQALTEDVLSKIRAVTHGPAGDDRQGSLLIVDDNPMNRDLLARQLARRGYLVATADNGHHALERMAEQSFDVVLLDVVMPELDGLEVLQRMQGDRNLRDIPVIMISALDEIDSVIRCLEIGAADFLSKPFHPTLLDVRINACLAMRRTRERERSLRAQLSARPAGSNRLSATAPASVQMRLDAGESRIFDATQHAAALWCDLERSLPVSGDANRRALALARILDAATAAARDNRCELLNMHTGIALVAGFPTAASARDSTPRLARAAIAIHAAMHDMPFRMGLHVGPLTGAVLGSTDVSYWMWGDALDLARRLASVAAPGSTFVSPAAHAEIRDAYDFGKHGVIDVPGRGEMKPFLLQGQAVVTAGG